jgi:hypothetical protein
MENQLKENQRSIVCCIIYVDSIGLSINLFNYEIKSSGQRAFCRLAKQKWEISSRRTKDE